MTFTGLPDFAPEILRRLRLGDPMKVKQMRRGLSDLAEEGVIRLFKPVIGSQWIVGVIGDPARRPSNPARARIWVTLDFEPSPYEVARWVRSDDPALLKKLMESHRSNLADDQDDVPVLLMRNAWEFGRFQKDWPGIEFSPVRERS